MTAVQTAVRDQPQPTSRSSEESAAIPAAYESPVDFAALWEVNSDIYAWLYIPDTQINYPILQREGDDAFYLTHDSEKEPSKNGALFTESTYNQRDFSDPVTVIYGHHMRSGDMFGNLQAIYSAQGGLKEHREILVYLPEAELRYQVFAAVPFHMRHILYYNNFSDSDVYAGFLEQVLSVRSISASIDEEAEVSEADQLLILSTCLQGNSSRRYLVLAKRLADGPIP